MSEPIDLNEILKDPFSNYKEYVKWIKSFKIDKISIDFIYNLLKKVENDLTYGNYLKHIIESKSIGDNPDLFIELISKHIEDFNIKWLIGNILYKFRLCTIDKIDDKISRLAYHFSRMYQEDINKEFMNDIEELWNSQDKEIMPYLICHTTRLSDKYDFTDMFLKINDEYLELLIRNAAFTNVNIEKLRPLLLKAAAHDKNSADGLWYCIYFKDVDDELISDLCITTLKNLFSYEMKFFDWCLKEKVKKSPKLVELIVESINELDIFDRKTLWGILTEGNPDATVKKTINLIKKDDKTKNTRRMIGACLEEIKRKLYSVGKKETCIEFYNILYNWLKNEDFIAISKLSEDNLISYSKNRLIRIIHEIIEQIRGWKSTFNDKNIETSLKKYPQMYTLIWTDIKRLLEEKEYHPLLIILEYSYNKLHRAFCWSKEILNKIEYYFNYFPKIKNGKYSEPKDIIKFMIADLFSDYYGFISEVYVFEKLHNARVILICEPNIGNKHPDYMIKIHNKKIIIEVKNYMLSEDILISGIGTGMKRKFSLDLNEAFKQTVPIDDPKFPVILILDSGRSFIEEDFIHDEFHGSLTYVWYLDKPEGEGKVYRKNDYLTSKKELATYLQGIVLFQSKMKNNKLILSGSFTEHMHRKNILEKVDFDSLNKILFS